MVHVLQDRPLSLTYMTFSTKCLKRKISTTEGENVLKEVPAKKLALAAAQPSDDTPKQSLAAKLYDVAQSLPVIKSVESSGSNEKANSDTKLDTNIVNPLPKTQLSPWKSKSETQQAAKPTQQVTGVKKVPQYAVRNLPFVNISSSSPIISQSITSITSSRPVSHIQSQTFSPLTPSQGKVKSINSIANRLQMEKVKSATESNVAINNPDSMKFNNNNSTNSPFMKQSTNPLRSSWVPSDISANMKRNMIAQKLNASTFRSPTFQEEKRNALMARQDIRPGTSGSSGQSSRGTARPPQLPAPNQGNLVRYRFPVKTPPNYNQVRRNNIRMAQQRQVAIRPKFSDVQRSATVRTEPNVAQQQQNFARRKNVPRTDDPQLLSTTLQLASLREQQKLLNEIAAAVSARNSNSNSNDSIRAVISGLSPKSLSSPRLASSASSTVNALRKAAPPPPMRSVARPLRPKPPMNSRLMKSPIIPDSSGRGGSSVAPKVNGSKSFNEMSHLTKNIGYPAINKRREGGIDIYQNTIARAKAQLREMNMKDRVVHQSRTQLRAAVSPYNVQSPNTTHKQSPVPYRPPSYQNFVQRGSSSTSSVSSMNHQRRSSPTTYRGVTTKPPPPPHSPQRYMSPAVFQSSMVNRQHRPPPPPPPAKIPPVVKQVDAGVPEQEQPLCLVVKK